MELSCSKDGNNVCIRITEKFVNYWFWEQVPVCPAHSSTQMIQTQVQKQKTRLMRIQMVSVAAFWFRVPWVSPAEEYYKNDYPDEDYDSEFASGLYHYHLKWRWPDYCLDEFHEEPDYDNIMHEDLWFCSSVYMSACMMYGIHRAIYNPLFSHGGRN